MSGLLAGKVWLSDLARELKPLAATLADIANDDGTSIYPSVAYVAWRLSCSERSVQAGLAELREAGILERVANEFGGRTLTTEYRLIEAKLPKREPWQTTRKGENPAPFSPTRTRRKGAIRDAKGCNLRHKRVKQASPDSSLSVSETSGAAPVRGSQDTRSAAGPSVEKAERQFPEKLEALAKEKSLPRLRKPTEPLRAELWDAIYFDKLENVFFDGHRLSFEEQLCGVVHKAVQLVAEGRKAKLRILCDKDIEMCAIEKLKPHLKALKAVPNLSMNSESFARAIAEHVRTAVTEAAAELYESVKDADPPKSSPERALQVAV